ncbi:MAG: hypothetical protein Q9208_001731 [Pyrenodesmia sp. 3 TL-2023]
MDLPPFAPFPPANLRKEIVPEEWELCLDAWLLLAEGHLLLPLESFASKLSKDPSLPIFLSSYAEATAADVRPDELDPKSKQLRRSCYLLIRRCLSEPKQKPPLLLEWQFLSDVCIIYTRSPSLKSLLQGLWQAEHLDDKFKKHKTSLTRSLDDAASRADLSELQTTLARTAALLRACPAYGQYLLLGSDFIDAVTTLHGNASPAYQKRLVVITYRCFLALMDPSFPRFSTLLDHLYSMNSSASLLAALCSSTPFVQRLRERIAGPEAIRAEKLIQRLSAFEGTGTLANRGKKPLRNKSYKGKGKQKDEYGHGSLDEGLHVHRMSLVTQVQDLFPDLGSGFIVKLLNEYNDDTEQVTAHLLDDSLPAHLQSLDRSVSLPHPSPQLATDHAPHLSPRTTTPLLPTRRNIHDNDAFDRLTIDPSQIHRGLKSSSRTADTVLQDRSSAPNKAAILSALAAFDSDDDERDDTYDVEDVGGTVDTAVPGSDEVDADLRDKNEEALFRAWKMSPEVFERDAATKRGKPRTALRSETGMTDEAIEGWGIMVGRDPRRLRRLEARFEMFGGQQRELGTSRYREGEGTDDSDRGEGSSGGRSRGGFRGRGRGRGGRGGGGGDVAGPADDKATQVARQRKDASKGTRANHNRRDQRARKVARAGFPG